MSKYLLIGDIHAEVSNLEETSRLIDWTILTAKENNSSIVFLGDIYHTMSIVRAEVAEFWYNSFNKIKENGIECFLVVGNHDQTNDGKATILTLHKNQINVISDITKVSETIFGIPFIRNNEEFINATKVAVSLGAKVILCHAEFNGAQYENGFYSPHGIDVDQLPNALYISGHIHSKQVLTNKNGCVINYIGTPRHLTRSDAGTVKYVTMFESETGKLVDIEVPESVCQRFIEYVFDENINGSDTFSNIKIAPKTFIDIKGSPDFIKKTLRSLPEGIKVRTFPEMKKSEPVVVESMGIKSAFAKYAADTLKNKNTDQETVIKILRKVYDLCPALRS